MTAVGAVQNLDLLIAQVVAPLPKMPVVMPLKQAVGRGGAEGEQAEGTA